MVLKNKPAKFRDLSHFFAIPKSERFLLDSTFYMVSSSVCFKWWKDKDNICFNGRQMKLYLSDGLVCSIVGQEPYFGEHVGRVKI